MVLNNLENLIFSQNKPHAILIVDNKMSSLDIFINAYVKSFLCENFKTCHDKCIWCQKINDKNYHDSIVLDGYKKKILKDDILKIQESFNVTGVEKKNKKFYILKGVESATAQACNSLLKFLELPPDNTYAILTTRNLQQVLPTIQSRCQIYRLFSNDETTDKFLSIFELNNLQKKIIKKIYYDINDLQNDMINGIFLSAFDFANALFHGYNDLIEIKVASGEFKKMDYSKIEKIILILKELSHYEKNNLFLELINNLKLNPPKILIFNIIVKINNKGKYK